MQKESVCSSRFLFFANRSRRFLAVHRQAQLRCYFLKLEQQMHKAARDLNFEEAAKLRDEIQLLRKVELGIAFS